MTATINKFYITFKPSTGTITKSGATLMEVAVHKGKLDVIKYLVTEQNVDVNGKPSRVLQHDKLEASSLLFKFDFH